MRSLREKKTSLAMSSESTQPNPTDKPLVLVVGGTGRTAQCVFDALLETGGFVSWFRSLLPSAIQQRVVLNMPPAMQFDANYCNA